MEKRQHSLTIRGRRYLIFVCLAGLFTTGYFYFTKFSASREPVGLKHVYSDIPPNTLRGKIARADIAYERALRGRQELVQKWTPQDGPLVNLFIVNSYTVWDFFVAAWNCPWEITRVGNLGEPGKWVCGVSRLTKKKDCVVYSIGNNRDSSWETGILSKTRYCQVFGYESPENVKQGAVGFGPEISLSQGSKVHFDERHFLSSVSSGTHKTLQDLMVLNGHAHIDILKIDLDRDTFDVLTALAQNAIETRQPLPFGQLVLEIQIEDRSFKQILAWWDLLEKAGLRPFMTEFNLAYKNLHPQGAALSAPYSFLNRNGANVFITE